jgi:hypothetical protein
MPSRKWAEISVVTVVAIATQKNNSIFGDFVDKAVFLIYAAGPNDAWAKSIELLRHSDSTARGTNGFSDQALYPF